MPRTLSIRGAAEHNLNGVDLDLPHNSLVVLCGVSGSGKSSLVFDTVYAEAQRRFYAALDPIRARGKSLRRPAVRSISGLAPPIAIDQHGVRADPRSTAGTLSGAYEFFRLLFARLGQPRCPECGADVIVHRFEEVYERAAGLGEGTRLTILAPVRVEDDGGGWLERIERSGFGRLRMAGDLVELSHIDAGGSAVGSTVEVVVDRLVIKPDALVRLKGSLEAAVELSGGGITLIRASEGGQKGQGEDVKFSTRPSCSHCDAPFEPITPGLFSFSSPRGACSECRGTGVQAGMEFERFFPDPSQILDEALGPLWSEFGHMELREQVGDQCERAGVDAQQPIGEWSADAVVEFWKSGRVRGATAAAGSSGRKGNKKVTRFPGLRRWLERRAALAEGEELSWLEERLGERPCAQCQGSRLSVHPLSVWLGEETIASLMAKPVTATLRFLNDLEASPSHRSMAEAIVHQTARRLQTIDDLGLGYLSLDRRADTLSSGELQRLRLAAVLGSDMTGMLYVLDEPSVGLHARDADRLGEALLRLRDQGNTLLVVEHDLSILERADHLVEMGPGAGVGGGEVVTEGTPGEVAQASSPTGRYLRGDEIDATVRWRSPGEHGWLELTGASGHNLKGIDISVPLQCLVAVSGVSGSGKSSLVHGTLYRAIAARLHKAQQQPLPFTSCTGVDQLARVLAVDQKSIGRSARSNAASYAGLLTPIRRLYAELPEARLRGYKPAHFSFNVPLGACSQCGGTGLGPRTPGQFGSLTPPCATCSGQRFKAGIRDIRFRQASIVDVLEMRVSEALSTFEAIPQIERRLRTLCELGLGYLVLGQSANSLSGGEAQRLKLTAELSRSLETGILYILDEPTTGLHIRDVEYLIELLQLLVDGGHTVIVVEHDLDVIRCADYVIDIGPEPGDDGGQVVAAGTPAEVAATPGSHTGRCLADEGRRRER